MALWKKSPCLDVRHETDSQKIYRIAHIGSWFDDGQWTIAAPSLWLSLRLYPYFNTAALVKRFFKLYERCLLSLCAAGNDETRGKLSPQQIRGKEAWWIYTKGCCAVGYLLDENQLHSWRSNLTFNNWSTWADNPCVYRRDEPPRRRVPVREKNTRLLQCGAPWL